MIKELSNKYIYDDFINKTFLTNDEKQILDMLLKKETIVKISLELNMSDRNVGRIIRDIKNKYNNFREIELAKLKTFTS